MKFSKSVTKSLKKYVYLYSHPTTNEIFYVGKGKGNRVFSHLEEEKENEKANYLKELQKQGLKPKIEILIHGIEDDKTALRVESSIIDLLGINKLTNKQSGWKSAHFGRMTIEQILSLYARQKTEITEPSIVIRINKAFRYSMSEIELYDFTRAQWRVDVERAKKAKYAFAVYEGVIQEVYEILNWYPAGQTFNVRNDYAVKGRWEFIGNLAQTKKKKVPTATLR